MSDKGQGSGLAVLVVEKKQRNLAAQQKACLCMLGNSGGSSLMSAAGHPHVCLQRGRQAGNHFDHLCSVSVFLLQDGRLRVGFSRLHHMLSLFGLKGGGLGVEGPRQAG